MTTLFTDIVTLAFKVAEVAAGAFALTFAAAAVLGEHHRFRLRRRELREYRSDRAALRLVESSNVVDLALYASSRGPERAA